MGLSISGLSSGFDWQNVVSQLKQVEQQRVTTLQKKQTVSQNKLSAWQTLATKLKAFGDASTALKTSSAFDLFSTALKSSSTQVDAASILSATASTSASKGTYDVVVNNIAKVEKLGSQSYTSKTTAIGVSGTILVGGVAVNIGATDTLNEISSKINAANTGEKPSGVVSSILQESANSFKLVLTSGKEGAAGISLLNGSGTDTLGALGFNSSGTQIKNSVVGGARSDAFSSDTTAVESLLGNETQALAGSLLINGKAVTIDLSDSLTTIKNNLNTAGIAASVVSEKNGADTVYRLQIENLVSWSDNTPTDGVSDTNVLQALGLVEGTRDDVIGVTSSVKNTTDGTAPITSTTKLSDIFGYGNVTAGDKITISGTAHDGTAVAAVDFSIGSTSTVGNLLDQIKSTFGNVTASVTADGRIEVVDNQTGTSKLAVNLQSTVVDGKLDFGSFSSVGAVRKLVVQQGKDASFTVDGVAMTSESNTVTTAIPGVTLSLAGADPSTSITVNVDNDAASIESKVKGMLDAYNDVIKFINSQMTYNSDTKKTGGPLFGDNQLKAIKQSLQSAILSKVSDSTVSYLSDVGVSIGNDNTLSLKSDTFKAKLATSFNDVVKLFANSGSGSSSTLQYVYSSKSTLSGTYNVDVTGTGTTASGTIAGVAATAAGTLLTVNDPNSPANGLQIRYTGTGALTGTFTFSKGIASLLESALNSMTDSLNGTVTTQQKSLQDNIDALNTKISDTNDRIDRKMNALTLKFQSMETALASMQSQSSFLSKLNSS